MYDIEILLLSRFPDIPNAATALCASVNEERICFDSAKDHLVTNVVKPNVRYLGDEKDDNGNGWDRFAVGGFAMNFKSQSTAFFAAHTMFAIGVVVSVVRMLFKCFLFNDSKSQGALSVFGSVDGNGTI